MLMQADAKHDGMCLLKRKQRRPKHSGHVGASMGCSGAVTRRAACHSSKYKSFAVMLAPTRHDLAVRRLVCKVR